MNAAHAEEPAHDDSNKCSADGHVRVSEEGNHHVSDQWRHERDEEAYTTTGLVNDHVVVADLAGRGRLCSKGRSGLAGVHTPISQGHVSRRTEGVRRDAHYVRIAFFFFYP